MADSNEGVPYRDEGRLHQLFQRAVQGDPDAFWGLIEPFSGLIYSVAFGIMKDPERARDILHETYIKAFGTLHNLRDQRRLASWLHSMTARLCYDALRRQSRERQHKDDVFRQCPRVVPIDEVLIKEEELKRLDAILATLPEPFRIILGMKYMNRWSCEEIAVTLDVPLGTVKSRLFEARKLLARRMEEEEKAGYPVRNGGAQI